MSWAWWTGTWLFCYPKTLKFSEKESGHRQVKDRVIEKALNLRPDMTHRVVFVFFFFKFSLVNIQIFLSWQSSTTGL